MQLLKKCNHAPFAFLARDDPTWERSEALSDDEVASRVRDLVDSKVPVLATLAVHPMSFSKDYVLNVVCLRPHVALPFSFFYASVRKARADVGV